MLQRRNSKAVVGLNVAHVWEGSHYRTRSLACPLTTRDGRLRDYHRPRLGKVLCWVDELLAVYHLSPIFLREQLVGPARNRGLGGVESLERG